MDLRATGAPTVCAVVVTYNRPLLLAQCLDHLAAQSRRPDHVLVVDNASTDETPELLAARTDVEVLTLETNTGGSGGFNRGVQEAHARGYEWLWLLDDDTLADERCLEALLDGAARAPRLASVMASAVRWKDGSLHPMNRPWLRLSDRSHVAVAAEAGLTPIRASTFVSTMVHREVVDRHGLPPGHYFIWLDDIAFTGVALREGDGYLVPESVAWHWTERPYDTLSDTRERFYFKVRNHLWLLRGPSFGGLDRVLYTRSLLGAIGAYLRASPSRSLAVRTVFRGLRDGLGREPG